MKIERLHLHPFAGTLDREVRFGPGLNVILGPNEAGKSTLRRALRHLLFVSTKLSKRQVDEEIKNHLPLGGGDTLRVSGTFIEGDETWSVSKCWAGTRSSIELKPSSGGILSEIGPAEKRLAELCGLSQGTWEHVLMAPQGEIGDSLDRIDPERDLSELSQRLRRTIFETDGVSLEALAESIERRWLASFGRWDREFGRPEGNRGIANPWTRETGRILRAYYECERARIARDTAERFHREHDAAVARVQQARIRRESSQAWVDRHESVARDATERAGIETRLAKIEANGKGLKEISQEWPVVLSKLADREKEAAELDAKVALLGKELEQARVWEAAAESRRILAEAEKADAALAEAREARDRRGPVDPREVDRLEKIQRDRETIRLRLDAAKLRVRFRSEKAVELETVSGVGVAQQQSVAANGSLVFEAGGRVLLRNADQGWEVEVASGDVDPEAELQRETVLAATFTEGLAKLGVVDLPAAKAMLAESMEMARRVKDLEARLAEIVGPISLEERRAFSGNAANGTEPERGADRIGEELGKLRGEKVSVQREADSLKTKIALWTNDHVSPDDLLDRLADLRAEHRAAKQKLEVLQPLPESFADATAFLREFRHRQGELSDLREAEGLQKTELARIEGSRPEIEIGDAVEALAAAENEFQHALREGEAIDRIRRDFRELRASIDEDTLGPWQKHLAEILAPLTDRRYLGLSPHNGTVTRADALELRFDLLSAGAKASLGLAVRLAMARWFLEGRGGFVFLDDPLVDLDPDRQKAAAAMLRHFAEEKQVIVLTCHPGHAEVLGGTTIAL